MVDLYDSATIVCGILMDYVPKIKRLPPPVALVYRIGARSGRLAVRAMSRLAAGGVILSRNRYFIIARYLP